MVSPRQEAQEEQDTMISNNQLYQAYALTIFFIFLIGVQLFVVLSTPRPVARWHEAAVHIENDLYTVSQPEHYFVEYSDGSIRRVDRETWENAPLK